MTEFFDSSNLIPRRQYQQRLGYKAMYNKHKVKTSSENYKRILATEHNLFKLSKIEQLHKIKTSKPRKFWKFLNGNKKNTSNISVEKCFDFFKI